jgi:hypothetical protein
MGIDYNSFSSTQVFVLRLKERMELNTIKKIKLRTPATQPSALHCNSQQYNSMLANYLI